MADTPDGAEVRVVLAGDQAVVRERLLSVLGPLPGITVVGAAADGAEALRMVAEHQPDVLLVDLPMPGPGSLSTTMAVHSDHPGTEVVVLTAAADDDALITAIAEGARGFLSKDADAESIAYAVRTAATELSTVEEKNPSDSLTPREVQVLRLIAAGLSNGEIARRLVVGEATVKTHVNHLFGKLGLRDRAQAVSYAYRSRLIRP